MSYLKLCWRNGDSHGLSAARVKREAAALRDPVRAKFLQTFFRTGMGEYGEGDRLLGLTVPDSRRVAKAFRGLPLDEIAKLMASRFHEHRLIGLLILVDEHARAAMRKKRSYTGFIWSISPV